MKYLLIMIIAAIILGLVIIGLIVLINHLSKYSNDFDGGFFLGMWFTVFCVIEVGMIIGITEEPKPRVIDVYQGKTTLEYTIRDGVKIDSVVVFKESYGKD